MLETSANMKKTAITSHKSHMSFRTCLPARLVRSVRDACPRRPCCHDRPHPSDMPPCKVDGSVRGLRQGTAKTANRASLAIPATPATRPASRGRAAAGRRCQGRAGGGPARQPAGKRRTRMTRGSERPLPERGPRSGSARVVSAEHRHRIEKGQGAYFPADGTENRGPARVLRLSRCESLICAQDLQSTTLSNIASTKSNIFGFVMT